MRALRFIVAGFLLVAATGLPLFSQQGSDGPRTATVIFTLDFPGSEPSHYSIAIREDGHGTYESSAKVSQDSEDQLYESEFEVSAGNREKTFGLARQAGFFAGTLDSGNRKLAFTGTKTLSYQDGQRKNSATYNYSPMPAAQQLTALFQGLGSTLEYGRMLAYSHRYQKLALDDQLKRMEIQAKNNELSEIRAIAPVLQEILDDSSVMNVVRARAQKLIEMGKVAASGGH